MACNPQDILGCAGDVAGGIVGGVVSSAWESVCRSFADAATELLHGFANVFVSVPPVNLSSGGVQGVYAMSLGISGVVAALLFIGQVIRTAFTRDGSALAYGLVGLGRSALAFMLTLTVAGTALVAADQVSAFIVERTFGSSDGLRDKLMALFAFSPTQAPSLVLILAVVGIVLTIVLWFELLLRNAAIAVLIATSPVSAAGQVSEATKAWWSKLVAACVQLIVLKPAMALVFALGFGLVGDTGTGSVADVQTLLAGMLVLLLAALAWPAIARFFTFTSVQVGGGHGLAAVLGFAAGHAGGGGGGGAPVGVSPDQFGQATESRTMAQFGAKSATAYGSGGSAGAGAAAGGAAAAGSAGVAVVAVEGMRKGLGMAQRAANSLTGRMEQTAGHAGLDGANPYAHPAGYPRHTPTPMAPSRADASQAPQPGQPEAPTDSPLPQHDQPLPPPPRPAAAAHTDDTGENGDRR